MELWCICMGLKAMRPCFAGSCVFCFGGGLSSCTHVTHHRVCTWVVAITSCGAWVVAITSCSAWVVAITSCGPWMVAITSCGAWMVAITSCGAWVVAITSSVWINFKKNPTLNSRRRCFVNELRGDCTCE